MGKARYTTEQIIVKLREIDLFCGQEKQSQKRDGSLGSRCKRTTDGARNTAG